MPWHLFMLSCFVRIVSFCLRALRLGHGSTMPGRLAIRLAPDLWESLAALPYLRLILVSGTNGKTTTTHILHHLLRRAGWRTASNQSGANLEGGLLTSILTCLPWRMPAGAPCAFILEIDEAALCKLAPRLRPSLLVLTNCCRDQLDRYGELNTVADGLGRVLAGFPETTGAVLNADDPGVAALPAGQRHTLHYGLEPSARAKGWLYPEEHHLCRDCRSPLAYRASYLGHLGDWYCPSCGAEPPPRRISAGMIEPDADGEGSSFRLCLPGGEGQVHLPLPGLHNIYNALAAAGAAAQLGLAPAQIFAALPSVTPCFGRGERQQAGRRQLHLFLIKNPTGANTVLETVACKKAKEIWFLINDLAADGRDVSWLWDVDFESFWADNGPPARVWISGRRALDLAVRLRYAELPAEAMTVAPAIQAALKQVGKGPAAETCYVLATYTALLALRDRLKRAKRW